MSWVESYIENNNKMRKIDWVTEFYNIYNNYEGDLIEVVTDLSIQSGIRNRFTVLALGIFCEKSARAYVSRWLKNLDMRRLTRRNQTDALFLYTYEAIKDIPSEDIRRSAFITYLNEYLEWEKNNSLYAKGFINDRKPENSLRLFPDIVTFDDLRNRIALNSNPSFTGTMMTIDTDKAAMNRLDEIIAQKGSLSDFLNYLAFDDDSVRTYNIKTTLYVQKIIYNIIKSSLDILAEHNLPDSDELKKQYVEAKDCCLQKTQKSLNAFKRFLKYNRCFIDFNTIEEGYNVIKFRDWVIENKDKIKNHPEMIMEKIKNAKINYSSLFTSFYYYLTGVKSGTVEETVAKNGLAGYEELGLPYESHKALFGKSDAQFDKTTIRFFVKALGGNVFIDRTFLLLIGMFAFYDKSELNHILMECDYQPLSEEASVNSIDGTVLSVLRLRDNPQMVSVKSIVNTVNFLQRTTENITESDNEEEMIGTEERELFEIANSEMVDDFMTYIENADDDVLRDVFNGSNDKLLKKAVHDITNDELSKIEQ